MIVLKSAVRRSLSAISGQQRLQPTATRMQPGSCAPEAHRSRGPGRRRLSSAQALHRRAALRAAGRADRRAVAKKRVVRRAERVP